MGAQALHGKGYTLVELLMTVAIAAVLAILALPSFGALLGRSHARAAGSALETSLNQARVGAVHRGAVVVACPSADSLRCDRTTRWQHGWIVFADDDRDGQRAPEEALLGVQQAQAGGVAILGTDGRLRAAFRPDGSAGGTNMTLTVCDRVSGAEGARTLVISQAGRIRHGTPSAAAAAACLNAAGA